MRIGVVVPVFNRRGLVRECLDSIAAQSRAPERVVVVDDASTDDTAAGVQDWIAEQSGATDWDLRRLPTNGGPSRARNVALETLDDCEVIAFLDSDDLWPTDYLERAERTLAEQRDSVATVCDILREDSQRCGRVRLRDLRALAAAPTYWMVRRGAPTPSSVVARHGAIAQAGGFDESLRYGEDLALFLRVARRGAWSHLPGEPVRYRLGIGGERSEAGALSSVGPDLDGELECARIVDQFGGGRRLRALAWYRASSRSAIRGDWAECRRRCARSLRIAPWHTRAAWRWIRAAIRSQLKVDT